MLRVLFALISPLAAALADIMQTRAALIAKQTPNYLGVRESRGAAAAAVALATSATPARPPNAGIERAFGLAQTLYSDETHEGGAHAYL